MGETIYIIVLFITMHINEELLVRQLKEGHELAYKYLYDHHYVVLCKYANEFLVDPILSESIVNDLIFHLWEKRDTLDIQVSIRSYLMRATRNSCLNHLSSKRSRSELPFSSIQYDLSESYSSAHDQPLGKLLEQELELEIVRSIEKLSIECQAVFRKSRFENKKNEEIAQELGISINTVKYHIKNALSSLRKDLEKYLSMGILINFLL